MRDKLDLGGGGTGSFTGALSLGSTSAYRPNRLGQLAKPSRGLVDLTFW